MKDYSNSVYKAIGYDNRKEYLNSLADMYGVNAETVYVLADMLGEGEDFDGLISSIQDAGGSLF